MVKLFGYMYVHMYMTGYRISGFECAVNLNDTVPQALMRILLLTSELHSHAHSNVSFVCDLCENSQLQSKEPRIRIPIYGYVCSLKFQCGFNKKNFTFAMAFDVCLCS